jgi:hypothetical protein
MVDVEVIVRAAGPAAGAGFRIDSRTWAKCALVRVAADGAPVDGTGCG